MLTLLEVISGAVDDADALSKAHSYSVSELKSIDQRMINERGVFARIGMVSGEQLMTAIEASPDIPARVKAWFRPSEQGIDIADPSALYILAGMVTTGVITQAESDILTGSAYETRTPYLTTTLYQIKREQKTLPYTPIAMDETNKFAVMTTTADCEKHNPQIFVLVNGVYSRVAGFVSVEVAGNYAVQCPYNAKLYIGDAYDVVS